MTKAFSARDLSAFCASIAQKAGFLEKDARILGDCLVDAELRGIASHGVVHLPMHVDELERGLLRARPNVRTIKDAGASLVIEGDHALGQRLAIEATDLAVERARRFGVAMIGVRNSGSIGAIGYFALRAADQGTIGFVLQNTAAHLAPPGAIDKVVGNNPFAVGLPYGNIPVVLDIACSSVARANLVMAAKGNEKIPLDWAVDPEGRPTDDPQQALIGALLPFAGHKGYGLAFVLGLLAGPLLGLSDRIATHTMYFPRPEGFGVIIIAIDIEHFVARSIYEGLVADWITRLREARLAPGASPVRYPGERSHELKLARLKAGITLPDAVLDDLKRLATKYEVQFPDVIAP